MINSMALVAAMSFFPGQGALTLNNARITYGELGAVRTDSKFLPGDIFFVAFDIDGIKVDDTGRLKYSMGMEVVNKDNLPIFKQAPLDREDFLPLGGTKLPARAFITIGPEQAPGTYTCKVTVVDQASKSTQTLIQKFDVLPKSFGLVQVYTTSDGKGEIPAPPVGVPGQAVFVRFAPIGFARDPKTKQPNLDVEMAILTKEGTPALAKPSVLTIDKGVGEDETIIPLRFFLPMNRAGDFVVELKATDKVANKTTKVQIPIKVVAPAN
ncbi:MAG: hypothetical protein K8T89_12970 [Planctomycetes bacterium]|nr:hypothetical protein [Planctomycetota bacterium]